MTTNAELLESVKLVTTEQAYSAALDEIYDLRAMLASEARILEAHTDYKTFPKSRRGYALASVERMREMSKGNARAVIVAGSGPDGVYRHHKNEMDAIGAENTLTGWSHKAAIVKAATAN